MNKFFLVLVAVELLEVVFFNFLIKPPRIPGDLLIEKPNLRVYIPLASAIILSIFISWYLSAHPLTPR